MTRPRRPPALVARPWLASAAVAIAIAVLAAAGSSCSSESAETTHREQMRAVAETVPAPVGGRWDQTAETTCEDAAVPALTFESALPEGAAPYLQRLAEVARRRGRVPELGASEVRWTTEGDVAVSVATRSRGATGPPRLAVLTVTGPASWCS